MPRKSKKYHYIYKTTCIKTGRYYIGMHSTHNLYDGYLGSGTRLRYSINKYGEDNHSKEILEYLNSREELIKREEEIVTLNEIAKEECMNLRPDGLGGWSIEQQRINAINSNNKQKELRKDKKWRDKKSKALSKSINEAYKSGRKKVIVPDWTGRKHREETKRKIGLKAKIHQSGEGNSQFGKCWIYNEKEKRSIRIKKEELDNWINKGWSKGRKMKF